MPRGGRAEGGAVSDRLRQRQPISHVGGGCHNPHSRVVVWLGGHQVGPIEEEDHAQVVQGVGSTKVFMHNQPQQSDHESMVDTTQRHGCGVLTAPAALCEFWSGSCYMPPFRHVR